MGKEDDKAEKTKNVRRAAKSAFTGTIISAQTLLDAKHPPTEV